MSEVSRYTSGIPPLHTIKDVDTRRVLEAIVTGWRTRNGDLKPDSDERFVTKGELKKLVEDVNSGYFTSGAGAELVKNVVGDDTAVGERVRRLLDATTLDVVSSKLWAELGSRIPPIDVSNIRVDIFQLQDALDKAVEELDAASKEILNLKDGTTDIVIKTENGTVSIRALKDSVYDPVTGLTAATTAIGEINTISVDSKSASARQIATVAAQVNDPKTGLEAANANITEINTVTVTSKSANAKALAGLSATVKSTETGLKNARSDISEINTVEADSKSANALSLFGVRATVYDEKTGLAAANAAIVALNDVSATSKSATARFLHAVSADVGRKNKVFFQNDAPILVGEESTEYKLRTGDLWFDTDNKNRVKVWDGDSWEDASDTRIAGAEAAITTEKNTRVTADNALASAINTIWSAVGDNSALVQTGNETITNTAGAVAKQWNQLDAAIRDPETKEYISSTSVRQEAEAAVNKTGEIEAKYTVKIDTNGYVTGYGLISTANNSAPTSEFYVRADKFAVGSSEGPTAIKELVPFKVYTRETLASDGVTKIKPGVYMDTAVIADGTITTAHIGVGTITKANIGTAEIDTLQLAGEAVTVPAVVTGTEAIGIIRVPVAQAQQVWQEILSLELDFGSVRPTAVLVAGNANIIAQGGVSYTATRMRIRNATTGEATSNVGIAHADSVVLTNVNMLVSPVAGRNVIVLEISQEETGGALWRVFSRSLSAIGAKR